MNRRFQNIGKLTAEWRMTSSGSEVGVARASSGVVPVQSRGWQITWTVSVFGCEYFALRPPTDKMFGPLGHRGRPAGRVRSVVGSAANRRSGSVPGPRDGTVRRPRRGRSLVARAWAPNWVTIECAWKNRSVLVSDPWPLMIFHLIRLLVVGCTYFGQFPLFAISDLPCNDWPNIGN